jgi:hypothetical protein
VEVGELQRQLELGRADESDHRVDYATGAQTVLGYSFAGWGAGL